MNRIDEIREERKRHDAKLKRAERRELLALLLIILVAGALLGALGAIVSGCAARAKADVRAEADIKGAEVSGSADVDAPQVSEQAGSASGSGSVRNVSVQSSGMWGAVIVALMTAGGWMRASADRKQANESVRRYDGAVRRLVRSIEDAAGSGCDASEVKGAVRSRGQDAAGMLIQAIVREETRA